MSSPSQRARSGAWLVLGLAAALAVVGVVLAGLTSGDVAANTAATTGERVVPTTAPVLFPANAAQSNLSDATTADTAASEQAANPIAIRIPQLDIDAPMSPLGVLDDGTIDVPSDPAATGWWVDGPEPGEPGPAVILGHVDSRTGPAVFYRLRDLRAGDLIHVDRSDATTVTYVVDGVEQHSKDDFPTSRVYGPAAEPLLRLVTCGGFFDHDVDSYRDNLIVFAHEQI